MPKRTLRIRCRVLCILVVSAWVIHGCLAPAFGQKRVPPVVASLRVESASLRLGDVADVTLRLTALAPVDRAEAMVIVPAQMEFVSGDRGWTGPMTANQVVEIRLRLRVVDPGTYTLGARVVMVAAGGGLEEIAGAVLYFVATPSQVTWGPASLPAPSGGSQGTRGLGTPGVAVPETPTPGARRMTVPRP